MKNLFLQILKGKAHPEGYISTYKDGSKWQKKGKKWVCIKEAPKEKKKPAPKKKAQTKKPTTKKTPKEKPVKASVGSFEVTPMEGVLTLDYSERNKKLKKYNDLVVKGEGKFVISALEDPNQQKAFVEAFKSYMMLRDETFSKIDASPTRYYDARNRFIKEFASTYPMFMDSVSHGIVLKGFDDATKNAMRNIWLFDKYSYAQKEKNSKGFSDSEFYELASKLDEKSITADNLKKLFSVSSALPHSSKQERYKSIVNFHINLTNPKNPSEVKSFHLSGMDHRGYVNSNDQLAVAQMFSYVGKKPKEFKAKPKDQIIAPETDADRLNKLITEATPENRLQILEKIYGTGTEKTQEEAREEYVFKSYEVDIPDETIREVSVSRLDNKELTYKAFDLSNEEGECILYEDGDSVPLDIGIDANHPKWIQKIANRYIQPTYTNKVKEFLNHIDYSELYISPASLGDKNGFRLRRKSSDDAPIFITAKQLASLLSYRSALASKSKSIFAEMRILSRAIGSENAYSFQLNKEDEAYLTESRNKFYELNSYTYPQLDSGNNANRIKGWLTVLSNDPKLKSIVESNLAIIRKNKKLVQYLSKPYKMRKGNYLFQFENKTSYSVLSGGWDEYHKMRQMVQDAGLDLKTNADELVFSSTYWKGKNTSYGDVQTSDKLKKKYGVMIKMQNGKPVNPEAQKDLDEALGEVWKAFGDRSEMSKNYGLRISHAGTKLQHAKNNAIGIFHPGFNAIGVGFTNKAQGHLTLAHEFGHFMDHYAGKKQFNSHYASSTPGTLESKIADKFRDGMTNRANGKYYRSSAECFARAMESYFLVKTGKGYNSNWKVEKGWNPPEAHFMTEVAPLVDQFFKERSQVLKATGFNLFDTFLRILKGKVLPEGHVSTRKDGSKWKKQNKKWVAEGKKEPKGKPSSPKSKEKTEAKKKKNGDSKIGIGNGKSYTFQTEDGHLTYSIEENEITLDNIKSDKKRKGGGSRLLNKLKKIAKDKSLPITGYAYPQDDTIDDEGLKNFYLKNGFELSKHDTDGRDFIWEHHKKIVEPTTKSKKKASQGSMNLETKKFNHFKVTKSTLYNILKGNVNSGLHLSDAQKEAGNYKKKKIQFQGLAISIENQKGSYRSGTDPQGNKWKTKMYFDYGYIRRTLGADGDHVDCFIGPHKESEIVYVINQVNPNTKEFDEHKVMLGFVSEDEAKKGYLKCFQKNWKGLGEIFPITMDQFKAWLQSISSGPTKPFDQNIIQVQKAKIDIRKIIQPEYIPERNEEEKRRIDRLKETIAENGYDPTYPIQVKTSDKTEDAYEITSGLDRYLAVRELVDDGVLPPYYRIPAITEAEKTYRDVLAKKRPKGIFSQAKQIQKMQNDGLDKDAIAEKLEMTFAEIDRRIALSNLIPEIEKFVRKREVPISIGVSLGTFGVYPDGTLDADAQIEGFKFYEDKRLFERANPVEALNQFLMNRRRRLEELGSTRPNDTRNEIQDKAKSYFSDQSEASTHLQNIENMLNGIKREYNKVFDGPIAPSDAKKISASMLLHGEPYATKVLADLQTLALRIQGIKDILESHAKRIEEDATGKVDSQVLKANLFLAKQSINEIQHLKNNVSSIAKAYSLN
jgi:hypothetical protein